MIRIPVKLRDFPYDILVGADCLKDAGAYIRKLGIGDSAFVITNTTIAALYEKPLVRSLRDAGISNVQVNRMRDGERYKNHREWEKCIAGLAAFDDGERKRMFVINLGGGVVGDLGGFVAATFHRGIPFVQVPTTLLACVDSGVGGKVGVNFGKYKNSLGAIWQPRLVFADVSVLKTLSTRQLKAGLAEVIKYGVSMDGELLSYVEAHHAEIFGCDPKVMTKISQRCYELKAGVVERDERDTKGIRVVLNYGHTVGHAVESASRYSYTHGESIAIGMACANDIAVGLGLLKKDVADRVERLLQDVKLPVRIKNCRMDDILASMANDKKFVHGKNRFVLLTDVGRTAIREDVPRDLIRKVIAGRMEKG